MSVISTLISSRYVNLHRADANWVVQSRYLERPLPGPILCRSFWQERPTANLTLLLPLVRGKGYFANYSFEEHCKCFQIWLRLFVQIVPELSAIVNTFWNFDAKVFCLLNTNFLRFFVPQGVVAECYRFICVDANNDCSYFFSFLNSISMDEARESITNSYAKNVERQRNISNKTPCGWGGNKITCFRI